MKPSRAPVRSPRSARGLSLIELLVSMAIGLVLMTAVVSAYLGSAGASRMAEAQGRMNEDAQAALSILTQQIKMAGNNPKQPNYASDTPRNPVFGAGGFGIRGCDGTFDNIAAAATIGALNCTVAGADSIAVSYEADEYNTVRTTAGLATDCLGQALPTVTVPVTAVPPVKVWDPAFVIPPPGAGVGAAVPTEVNFKVADNRFYVASGTGGPSLYCKGNGGGNAQPLVENVEDLQITYGVAPSAMVGTLTVGGYLTATTATTTTQSITAEPTLAALATDALRWSKVATVRICIVVRTEQPVVSDAASAQYVQCDGSLKTDPPDLRLRRAYTTTVVLRNRVAS